MVTEKQRAALVKAREALERKRRHERAQPKPGFGARLWTDSDPRKRHQAAWEKLRAKVCKSLHFKTRRKSVNLGWTSMVFPAAKENVGFVKEEAETGPQDTVGGVKEEPVGEECEAGLKEPDKGKGGNGHEVTGKAG
ncbi:hypothetical protein DRE_03528 [Drechslerella stenobrocha 248]|uniref:Uncharacterized protein n=1 Tax=Drechslerella stenobrocha 248 TaxID=1043628 RepID=W7HUJ0_9PEZI|nr:hypothetical protein DRE_03528 [Drechslerella stenobrocha 248]